jgi:nicotinate-nucleotide adenylyltransferase
MRLEMCRLAFKDVPRVAVSSYEADKGGISYSIDTLRHFRKIYPDGRLYFIMGSDALPALPYWKDFKGLLKIASIIAASRTCGSEEALIETAERLSDYGEIIIVPITPVEISSTDIRKKILNNEDFSCYLSASVVEYIKNFQIYKE